MSAITKKNNHGFTLIEMITVIVILGVLAVGISSFLQFGSRIYVETTVRDQLISSARFAIERLNRDLRHALPNSAKFEFVGGTNKCLVFTPIVASTTYLDIPVLPENASNTITVVKFDELGGASLQGSWQAVVYPLSNDDVYSDTSDDTGKVHGVESVSAIAGDVWTITLDNDVRFEADSPTKKLYFIDGSLDGTVRYCIAGNALYRNNKLIAENIVNDDVFEVEEATLQRNAFVQVHFRFEQSGEQVTFINEVQVPNVP